MEGFTEDVRVMRFTEDGGVWVSAHPPSSLRAIERQLETFVQSQCQGRRLAMELGVDNFCVAQNGMGTWGRAQIRNLFTSMHKGTIAQLFFIDTASEGAQPLHELLPLPEKLLHHPLSEHYLLEGIQPRSPDRPEPFRLRPGAIGHTQAGGRGWADVAMEMLKDVVGSNGTGEGVKVQAAVKPGECVVLYCGSEQREVNFNSLLLETGLAVPNVVKKTAHVPDSQQLLSALQSLKELQSDLSPVHAATEPVKPVGITRIEPATTQQPIPYQYHSVYVKSICELRLHCSLEEAGFPGSVCRGLTNLGFQSPTPIQAYSWPHVSTGNTILISPPSSGKTLAYLLPLLTVHETGGTPPSICPQPQLVVLVTSSWQARAITSQTRQVLSWFSANKRFRCCCAYKAVEGNATQQLLNGVVVLVCTPPSLLRLVERDIAQLASLRHLVLDDIQQLQKSFPIALKEIMRLCHESTRHRAHLHLVMASSSWCQQLCDTPVTLFGPASLVIACPIEATISAGVKVDVVPCQKRSPESVLQQLLAREGCGHVVVCVRSREEGRRLGKHLNILCWPAVVVGGGKEGESVEELLEREAIPIIPDEDLSLVLPQHTLITQLVHFDLPQKKEAFTHRLALLYPGMHKKHQCSYSVLLSEDCQQQATLLKKIVERSGHSPPQLLSDLAQRGLEARELSKKDFDLCYDLKAWGECGNTQCPSRHTLTTPTSCLHPEPQQLPSDGSVKVRVSHVSNATRLWVSLVGHTPLYRGAESAPAHDPDGLVKMTSDLADYFTASKERQLHIQEVPKEGSYCALRDLDGCYHRVRILKFSRSLELMFHHREKAKVRLIDVGEVQVVDVTQLHPLPPHLLRPPAQVFEVFLCGVRPVDSDPDWPVEAAEYMSELYKGKQLHGRVALRCGETLWLDPVEMRVRLEGLNLTTALSSPQHQLLKSGMATANQDHLVNLANCLGLPLNTTSDCKIANGSTSFAQLPVREGRGEGEVEEEEVEVCVSAVESPSLFYLQLMEEEERVIAMEDKLNRPTDVATMITEALPPGSLCAAKYSGNNCWYRGCVLGVEGHQSQILFLDYGNTEWVPSYLVQPIHPSLLELPFQAIECTFGMEDTKWNTDAGTLLYEWTRDQILTVKVLSSCPSQKTAGATCYTVELYETTHSEGPRMNLALRLPQLTMPATLEEKMPPLTTAMSLDHLISSLLSSSTDKERAFLASRTQTTFISHPGVSVSVHCLVSLCQFLPGTTPPVSIPLLRTLCGLAAFHSSVRCELSKPECMKHFLLLMKESSGEVLEFNLLLMKLLLGQLSCYAVLCTEDCVKTLLHHLHGSTSPQSDSHILDIVANILWQRKELARVVVDTSTLSHFYRYLSSSSSSSSSSSTSSTTTMAVLRILLSVVTTEHRMHLCNWLCLSSLQKVVSGNPSLQVVRIVLQILLHLCDQPGFGERLHSSPLFATLQNIPMSATKCFFLRQLSNTLGPLSPSSLSPPSLSPSLPHNQPSPSLVTDAPPTSHISLPSGNRDSPPLIISDNYRGNTTTATVASHMDSTLNYSKLDTLESKLVSPVPCKPKPDIQASHHRKKIVPRRSPGQQLTVLHPRVLWSQGEQHVLLAVQLRGCKEEETQVSFAATTVSFHSSVRGQKYQFSIDLFSSVDPKACSVRVTGSEVLLRLVKAESEVWPHLCLGGRKLPLVGVDFDRWDDGPKEVFSNWPVHKAPPPNPPRHYTNPLEPAPEVIGSDTSRDSGSDDLDQDRGWEDNMDFDL